MSVLGRIRSLLGRREQTHHPSPWAHPETQPDSGDLADLEIEGDPRGGGHAPGYRRADPRDLVVGDRDTIMGPGGAPSRHAPPRAREAFEDEPPPERRRPAGDE